MRSGAGDLAAARSFASEQGSRDTLATSKQHSAQEAKGLPSLNLIPAVGIFPCPNCRGTINTGLHACPYCSFPLDPATADASAVEFSRVNQAISDASYLRVLGICALVFLLLRVVPFLGLIGLVGFWFVEIAIPVLAIRWFLRYRTIQPREKEMVKARRTAWIVASCGLVFFFLFGLGTYLW